MSRINSLINSSMRKQQWKQSQEQSTCVSNTSQKSLQMLNTLNNSIQPPNTHTTNIHLLTNNSIASNQNTPANMQESTHSDYDSRSQYSNFKKESINESEQNYVNRNSNVYAPTSKGFISQSSIDTEKSPLLFGSESSIMCRQESLNSIYSLKMKAHTPQVKDKTNQGAPIRFRAQSVDDSLDPSHQNNLLYPNGNPIEGRTKSPSKFKIDFDRSRASSDQFDNLNKLDNEEPSKENESHQAQQVSQVQSPLKKNKAREAATTLSKEEQKLKFKQGTLDEQFYNDASLS